MRTRAALTSAGLGLAVVGGLLFSQFLTLFVTPVFYVTMEGFREWSERVSAARKRRKGLIPVEAVTGRAGSGRR